MESSRPEYWSGYPFPSPGTSEVVQSGLTLCDPMDYSLPGSHPWNPLLQGIFPNQGLNPGLLHCRQILFFFLQADSLPAEQAPANKISFTVNK